jgi:hypothetical protein
VLPLVAMVAVPSPFIAGALLGIAVCTKPTALFFAPVLVVIWRRQAWRSGAGLVLVVAAVGLAFLPVWGDLLMANVSFDREFSAYQTSRHGYLHALTWLIRIEPSALLGAVPFWIAGFAGLFYLRSALARVWLVCAVVALKANGYFGGYEFAHYYNLLAAPLAIFAGIGMERMLRDKRATILLGAAGCFSLAIVGAGIALVSSQSAEYGDLVRTVRSSPGELYMLGGYPQVYVDADRPPQRRFFYNVPLIVSSQAANETRNGLRDCPPELLVVNNKPDSQWAAITWPREIENLYGQRRTFGDFDLLTEPIVPCVR